VLFKGLKHEGVGYYVDASLCKPSVQFSYARFFTSFGVSRVVSINAELEAEQAVSTVFQVFRMIVRESTSAYHLWWRVLNQLY